MTPLVCTQCLRIRLPLTGAKNPKIGKRGFRSQKTPISPQPQKRASRVKKSPFLYRAPQGKWDFLTRDALFWGGGKWGFFDSETSFPDFGVFHPCKGQTDSQPNAGNRPFPESAFSGVLRFRVTNPVCFGAPFPEPQDLRRADTQTPTPLAFLARTPTFPHSTVCECLKAFFRHASVFYNAPTRCLPLLKRGPKTISTRSHF